MSPLMHLHSGFSPKYHPNLQRSGCNKTLESPLVQGRRKSVKCSRSPFYLTSKIRKSEDISNESCKLMFNRPVTLQVCYASKSEDANQRMTSQEVFFKNLDALHRFIRPYTLMGTVIAITSVSLLPLQNLDDLTPTYFMGFFKAMVPGLLMTVYEVAINQLYDVKIDKVNKPNLPLTSGDLSMRTGIAIASSSLLMSLAMGIMLRSSPFLLALIIWFLLASAYSVDVEEKFISNYIVHRAREGTSTPICLLHTHSVAIKCCFCFVISVLKDIPDEDGDREFGIRTLSVILGKESVLWLCVYVLFIAYGAAVIVGLTSSPYLLSKLLMIISHSMLATLLWHQARTVDLSSKASTLSFYMFIWKLHYVECLIIPFVRL
ncbi:homogentisate geranylgeranyltransferase [Citrus sinensis]|uniref:Homogentisate geranylgeranyltransferase n=1 Tax=Citrus sinensis TaxID=2711 RepID=A0ACB8N2F1_CITSI|nr:homogentisate geranylgeranyltransferase [Citrus sinensis]